MKKRALGRRYRNDPFLKALGAHCRALRTARGYSIDRMAKESDQLSSSVIHRLEAASGPVTVSALYRFAQVLDIHPRELLDFALPEMEARPAAPLGLVADSDSRVKKEAFKTLLPVYSLKAAAGYFGRGEAVARLGWIEVPNPRKLDDAMFVVRAVGSSMEPAIRDGDLLAFRANPAGTRQGKVVLAQYRGPADPDTGGSFTVKKYSSVKVVDSGDEWRHRRITLSPANPDYEPIILQPKDEADFRIVGEYLFTVGTSRGRK
jgi:SOS-response transcriptional repressor LexA